MKRHYASALELLAFRQRSLAELHRRSAAVFFCIWDLPIFPSSPVNTTEHSLPRHAIGRVFSGTLSSSPLSSASQQCRKRVLRGCCCHTWVQNFHLVRNGNQSRVPSCCSSLQQPGDRGPSAMQDCRHNRHAPTTTITNKSTVTDMTLVHTRRHDMHFYAEEATTRIVMPANKESDHQR